MNSRCYGALYCQDGPLRMPQFARFRFVVDGFGLVGGSTLFYREKHGWKSLREIDAFVISTADGRSLPAVTTACAGQVECKRLKWVVKSVQLHRIHTQSVCWGGAVGWAIAIP